MGERLSRPAATAMATAVAVFCGAASATDFQLTRWAEDYSAYADAARRERPLDAIKYIPLGDDPARYLSLGGHLRYKVAAIDAPLLGLGTLNADGHVFQRVQLHADLHLGPQLRSFVELVDARAFDKDRVFPIDRNHADLQQAFVDVAHGASGGTLRLRAGRQELSFDATQRFVALREGPNVRRVFDGVRLSGSVSAFQLNAFHLRLVEPSSDEAFDDRSVDGVEFSGLRARHDRRATRLDAYVYRYLRDDAIFAGVQDTERRWVFGMHTAGRAGAIDWDLEAVYQGGDVGQADIRAWAAGSLIGYTFGQQIWRPRLGLQLDAASGDRDADDARVQTFNPLFPKGSYFTQAGLTDFANLRHAQLSIRVHPGRAGSIGVGAGHFARESRADAAYAQPFLPMPRSVTGGRAIADYLRVDARQRFGRHVVLAAEWVRYWPAQNLRLVGAQRTDYAELVIRFVF